MTAIKAHECDTYIHTYIMSFDILSRNMDAAEWKKTWVTPLQVKVYNVFKSWLDMRFTDFNYRLVKVSRYRIVKNDHIFVPTAFTC